jgi:phosphoglycolate phosphatase
VHDVPRSHSPAVIFDLDGTLADTIQDITAGVNVAIADVGLGPLDPDRVRELAGDGLPALIARTAVGADDETQARLVARFRAHYRDHLLDHTRLFPGITDVLDRLTAMSSLMAVLSNKPHDATQTICRDLLRPWPFIACWGADPNRPHKPDPAAALALAARLGRPPSDVVFVGDTAIDIHTAANASMRAIGVTWGFRRRQELVEAGANVIVDRPDRLVDAILARP